MAAAATAAAAGVNTHQNNHANGNKNSRCNGHYELSSARQVAEQINHVNS